MPNIPEEYLNVNQRAQASFAKLKEKMKLDLSLPIINNGLEEASKGKAKPLDYEKLQRIATNSDPKLEKEYQTIEATPATEKFISEIKEVKNNIENIFEWIDSLELDPKLSLAIGLIVSYKNTKNTDDLRKAIEALTLQIGV